MFYMSVQKADACTRAVYIGPDHMVVTGRTMDWKEDIMSNIYVSPEEYNVQDIIKKMPWNGLQNTAASLQQDMI